MARCVMALPGAAPCQCFTFGRQMTTSPWCMVLIGPPHSWVRPVPKVTMSVWPDGYASLCGHLVQK